MSEEQKMQISDLAQQIELKQPAQNSQLTVTTDWSMFKKETELGEGAYGTVFKVKSLKTSIISGDSRQRIQLSPVANAGLLRRKLNIRGNESVNMQSSDGKKVRSLIADQSYVIKVIDTAKMQKDSALEALIEIELLADFDCHFIVGYFDSFIVDTQINIVMEYCQHGDLNSYIKKQNGKNFVENFIWKVFIHICLGIYYLHSRDIIHRDLKSLNIFLTKDNSAKIGDLGAARRLDSEGNIVEELSEIPQKVGTPFYLAPELWNNKPCSKKSDIWALGVILYELCALQFPFQAEDMNSLEQKVLKEKPQQLPNGSSKFLGALIHKCLQKKAELRPTIQEIIKLDEFQQKCKLIKITLPLELNKEKLLRKKTTQTINKLQQIEPIPTPFLQKTQRNLSIVEELPRSHKRDSFMSSTTSLSGLKRRPTSSLCITPISRMKQTRTSTPRSDSKGKNNINISRSLMNLNLNSAIPETKAIKQTIKPQQNRTSKLRAALMQDIALQFKKSTSDEVQQSQTPFSMAKNQQNIKSQRVLPKQKQRFSMLAKKPIEETKQNDRIKTRSSLLVKRANVVQSARNLVESSEDEPILKPKNRVKYNAVNTPQTSGPKRATGRLLVQEPKQIQTAKKNIEFATISAQPVLVKETLTLKDVNLQRKLKNETEQAQVVDSETNQNYFDSEMDFDIPLKTENVEQLQTLENDKVALFSYTENTPRRNEDDVLFEQLIKGVENEEIEADDLMCDDESLLD